jgi:hypothetical protein
MSGHAGVLRCRFVLEPALQGLQDFRMLEQGTEDGQVQPLPFERERQLPDEALGISQALQWQLDAFFPIGCDDVALDLAVHTDADRAQRRHAQLVAPDECLIAQVDRRCRGSRGACSAAVSGTHLLGWRRAGISAWSAIHLQVARILQESLPSSKSFYFEVSKPKNIYKDEDATLTTNVSRSSGLQASAHRSGCGKVAGVGHGPTARRAAQNSDAA